MRLGLVALVVALGCSAAPRAPAPKAETRATAPAKVEVWATSSLVKVRATDPPPRAPESTIAIRAARNEFESAQIHVHAEGRARQGLRVAVTDLPAPFAPGDITLSLEGYAAIDTPSAPGGLRGRVPDVLFPERDALTGEARNAFPFEVPAGETRSVWIDVFVRPEVPPGDYDARIEVREGTTAIASVPVTIHVWGFTLPSTATLQSFFSATPLGFCTQVYGSYDGCAKYPGAEGNPDRGVELAHVAIGRFLLDRRISYAEIAYAGSARESWAHFDHVYDPLLFGTAATRLQGARLTTMAYVGPVDDPTYLRAWYQHAKERKWASRLVYYQCDEPPRTCSFERVQELSSIVHGVAKDFTTLVTTDMATASSHALLDGIDILVPNVAQLHPRDETNRRGEYSTFASRRDKRLWWYQDCSQHGRCSSDQRALPELHWPSYMIDASPIQNRVFQWLAFAYGVSGELYYQVDRCWSAECGGARDPFRSVRASEGHGDGTLIYPGAPARIGGTSPAVLSSVRLEHVRDGFEDYEYLALLQARGERAFADEVTKTFIEAVWRFSEEPARLLEARRRLGEELARVSSSPP